MENGDKKIILFVCKGNIHRSAIAEQVFKKILKENQLDDKIEVISRGIQGSVYSKPTLFKNITQYDKVWETVEPSLKEFNIDITKHKAKSITKEIADKASIIITFDKVIFSDHEDALIRQFSHLQSKIHFLSEFEGSKEEISDCEGMNLEQHRKITKKIFDILNQHWEKIVEYVT